MKYLEIGAEAPSSANHHTYSAPNMLVIICTFAAPCDRESRRSSHRTFACLPGKVQLLQEGPCWYPPPSPPLGLATFTERSVWNGRCEGLQAVECTLLNGFKSLRIREKLQNCEVREWRRRVHHDALQNLHKGVLRDDELYARKKRQHEERLRQQASQRED